jgi:hypothetical protein
MDTPAPPHAHAPASAFQLRKQMYSLLMSGDKPSFEQEYKQLLKDMEKNECMPPRSHFWDMGIFIPPELKAKYNRLQPIEVPACIFMALGLDKDGGSALSYDKDTSVPFMPLGHFSMDGLPDRMVDRCLLSFGSNTTGLSFLLKYTALSSEEQSVPSTLVARTMDARQQVMDRILKIEETRVALSDKIKKTMPALVALTDTPLHTHVDSDHGSDDDENDDSDDPDANPNEEEEDDDYEVKPSPSKRRKCYDDMGRGKDTPMQKVHFLGIKVSPPSGVDSMRIREFKGDPKPHFVELMGSIICDRHFETRLPVPKAPSFPDGTDPEDEGKGVFSNTALWQKMMDTDPTLAEDYEEMQRMAFSMRSDLRSLVRFLKESFNFFVRIEKKEGESEEEVPIQSLSVMQKFLIGKIYLRTIAVCKGEDAEEEEGEESSEEEEGEESSDEEEGEESSDESGSDEEYKEESESEEEEEEKESDSESESESESEEY